MDEKSLLRKFIFNNFMIGKSDADLKDDDSFLETGIIDSTGVLELILFLEENFKISIPDEDLIPENLDTVNNILNYIQKKGESEFLGNMNQ